MKVSFKVIIFLIVAFGITCTAASAQRRRVVVVRHPTPVRHTLVVHANHPIRRALPTEVVVRPARHNVVVTSPLVYLPAIAWTATVATLPGRQRLAWQDSETISRTEGWVDTNFGIDESGDALFLDINGKAKLNFAEVTFANGNVQVVDFNERTHGNGIYKLLDWAGARRVSTVRILAKSESEDTKLAVYVSR
jgi:hypothetical protein